MNTILSLLRDFLAAQQSQQETKAVFLSKHFGDEGYQAAQSAFRSADDRFEELFQQVVPSLQEAHADDIIDELIEALGEPEVDALHRILSSRSLQMLLDANANVGLSGLIRKYRKASALFSAARELNSRRRQLDAADFEELLDTPPAGVDAQSWEKVVQMLSALETALKGELGESEVEPEDITREAAHRIEAKLRKRCDELIDKVVTVFRDLMDNGRFDLAVSELEPEERRAAYDLQRCVPQPQRQTATQPAPRTVQVL